MAGRPGRPAQARWLYLRDVHYIVRDGEVQIVDEFTGRVMPRRRWTDNIHQAVEAKEGCQARTPYARRLRGR